MEKVSIMSWLKVMDLPDKHNVMNVVSRVWIYYERFLYSDSHCHQIGGWPGRRASDILKVGQCSAVLTDTIEWYFGRFRILLPILARKWSSHSTGWSNIILHSQNEGLAMPKVENKLAAVRRFKEPDKFQVRKKHDVLYWYFQQQRYLKIGCESTRLPGILLPFFTVGAEFCRWISSGGREWEDIWTISVLDESRRREFLDVKQLMAWDCDWMDSMPILQVLTLSAWAAELTWRPRITRFEASLLRSFKSSSIAILDKIGERTESCLTPRCTWKESERRELEWTEL